jgi:hypothetical protein
MIVSTVAAVATAAALLASLPVDAAPAHQQWAGGQPIHRSCTELTAAIERMRDVLQLQEQWIRSGETQVNAAVTGVLNSMQAADAYVESSARNVVLRLLKEIGTLRTKARLLAGMGLDKDARRRILALEKKAERIDKFASEMLQRLERNGVENDFFKKLREGKVELMELLVFADQSGLAEHLLAPMVKVPVGAVTAELTRLLIEVSLLGGDHVVTESELQRAQADLSDLKSTRDYNRSILASLESERAAAAAQSPCPEVNSARPQNPSGLTPPLPDPSMAPSSPPNATPAPKKPAQVQEKKGGGGDAVTIGLLGAAAVVGYYGYDEWKKSQGGQCTPPSVNPLTVCSSQGGSSPACQSALADQRAYCTCLGLGYSGGQCR